MYQAKAGGVKICGYQLGNSQIATAHTVVGTK